MSDSNIYLGTIEKTGEKVLVWGGTYDMEDASMRWYEINDNRDWSDDKFSDFRLLSTYQLRLALAETATQLAQALTNRLDDCECDVMSDDLGWACVSDCEECGFPILGRGVNSEEAGKDHDRKFSEHLTRRTDHKYKGAFND